MGVMILVFARWQQHSFAVRRRRLEAEVFVWRERLGFLRVNKAAEVEHALTRSRLDHRGHGLGLKLFLFIKIIPLHVWLGRFQVFIFVNGRRTAFVFLVFNELLIRSDKQVLFAALVGCRRFKDRHRALVVEVSF